MSSKTKTTATKEEATPALVPKLRFPEFQDTDDWQTKLLGDLCKIRTGKKDANEGASDGQYPFFTCAENHIFSNSYSFDAEAILIAGNANVGQTRYYCGKFEAYQRTYVLTDFSGISVPYLYAVLNAKLRESLLAQVQVSAMSYIKLPMLQEYALAVPPSPAEQQKIAECLSSMDELMAAQARKVDALKTHKKGLMQQLFPREGETQPRLRFPEFQNAGEWVERLLESFIEEFRDKSTIQDEYEVMTSARSGLVRQREYYDNDRITERDNIGFNVIPPNYITYRSRSDDRQFYFNENNLGITGIVSVYYPVFRVVNGSNRFLIELLSAFSRVVGKYSVGTSQTVLSLNQLGRIRLPFPPTMKEQQRIASCLSSLDALITAETQKHEALKTHKKGLMQQLFPSPEEVGA